MIGRLRDRWDWVVVGSAMLLLTVVATSQLKVRGFWYDEAVSVTYARRALGPFIETVTRSDPNGIVYYVLLRGWHLLGDGEARIRFLSVVAAVAVVPLLYLVGRRHVGRLGAVLGCVLYAVNPFVIAYAEEARMYALAMLAVTGLVLAWSHATETDRRAWWAAYAALGVMALYVHFFTGFVILGLGLTWLGGLVPRTRRSVVAQAVVGLAALPIVAFAIRTDLSNVSWIKPFSDAGVIEVLGAPGGHEPVLALGLAAAALVAIPNRDPAAVRRLAPIVAWWLVPSVVGIGLSVWRSLLEPRYYIVALPALLLLAGAGLVRVGAWLASRWDRPSVGPALAAVGVVILAVLAIGPVDAQVRQPRGDWRAAAEWVSRTSHPGDRIAYVVDRGRVPMQLYLDRYGADGLVDASIGEVRASSGRVWLVHFLTSDYQQRRLRESLPGYGVVESKVFSGLRVQLLERPAGGG